MLEISLDIVLSKMSKIFWMFIELQILQEERSVWEGLGSSFFNGSAHRKQSPAVNPPRYVIHNRKRVRC